MYMCRKTDAPRNQRRASRSRAQTGFLKIVILRGRCAKNGKTAMLSALADKIFCSWCLLGNKLRYLELILVPLLAILGPSWGHLGRSEGHLGPLLRPIGAILGTSWGILSSSRALWGPSWPVWGASWAIWGLPWPYLGHLGASWPHFGPSRAQFQFIYRFSKHTLRNVR